MFVTFCKNAKSIHKTSFYDFIDSFAFLVCKSFLIFVLFRSGEVIGGMRHIQVAAKNDGLFFVECFHIFQKSWVPLFVPQERSEERRVGEEGRSRWAPYH